MDAAVQASAHPALESALDDAIAQLSAVEATPAVKSMLIEARRLRSVVGQWRTIHPPESARREMLSKVMDLASAALRAGGDLQRPSAAHRPGATAALTAPPSSGTVPAGQTSLPPSSGAHGSAASLEPPASFQVPASGPVLKLARNAASEPRFAASPGGHLVRGALVAWEVPSQTTGVTLKVLHHDLRERAQTVLVRLAPGAELVGPSRGTRPEELYVLEGSILVGAAELRTGDYCRFDPALGRAPLRSPAGCVVLVVGPER